VLGEAVARSEQDSGAGIGGGLEEKMTRGQRRSRRWTVAACTAAAGGAAPAAEQAEQRSREAEGVQRKKKRGRRSGDCFVKTKNFRDPREKKNFPLI
jgi:hypothetical protein